MHSLESARRDLWSRFQAAALAGAFATLLVQSASAETGHWTALGPYGQTPIYHIAVGTRSEGIVFASSSEKLFRTLDGGETWSIVLEQGPADHFASSIVAVAVAETLPATVYVSIRYRLFRSTNAGNDWTLVGVGFPVGMLVDSLAVDPLVPSTVYAGTNLGVYKTLDSGESWFPANEGLDGVWASSLAIDPVSPSTLYAVDSRLTSASRTLFKSRNGGLSWSRIDEGLKRGETEFAVQAVAVDPTLPSRIYASKLAYTPCTRCTSGPAGVFRSDDGGLTWDLIGLAGGLGSGLVTQLAVAPTSPATVFAGTYAFTGLGGIFVSSDAGATWSRSAADNETPAISLALDSSRPGTAYSSVGLGQHAALLKTTDSGRSWGKVEQGILGLRISNLVFPPADPHVFFTSTSTGVYRSLDAGASWGRFDPRGIGLGSATGGSVVADPSTARAVYLVGRDILRIQDDGAWTELIGLDFYFWATTLAIDPTSPSILYSGAADFGGSQGPGVVRSADGGHTWEKRSNGLPGNPNTLAIDPRTPSTLYAAPTLRGVYKSNDSGLNWRPTGLQLGLNIQALAIDPVTPAILYAGADTGFFRSADSGETWNRIGEAVVSIAIDPGNPFLVYAATCWSMQRSVDRGLTWTSVADTPCVRSLAIDPLTKTVYAGTESNSVWSISFLTIARPRAGGTRTLPFRP